MNYRSQCTGLRQEARRPLKFAKRFWRGKKLGGKSELATSNILSLLLPHLLAGQRDRDLCSALVRLGTKEGLC